MALLSIRLSDEEHKELKDRAKSEGVTMTEYVKSRTLGFPVRPGDEIRRAKGAPAPRVPHVATVWNHERTR